jgi:hypothetical protein
VKGVAARDGVTASDQEESRSRDRKIRDAESQNKKECMEFASR